MSLKDYFQGLEKLSFGDLDVNEGDKFFFYSGHKTQTGYVQIHSVDVLKDSIVLEYYLNEKEKEPKVEKWNSDFLKERMNEQFKNQEGLNAGAKYVSKFKETNIDDFKKLVKFLVFYYVELTKSLGPDFETEVIYEGDTGKQFRLLFE